jgi:RNA polymerase-binding protein DksA
MFVNKGKILRQSFIKKMKEKLTEQRNLILEALAAQNNEFKDLVSKVESGDEIDVASGAVDRNMLDSLNAQDANRLTLINNALLRIQQGKYGLCLQCGKPIPEARLEALPYAFMCINCASKNEKRR